MTRPRVVDGGTAAITLKKQPQRADKEWSLGVDSFEENTEVCKACTLMKVGQNLLKYKLGSAGDYTIFCGQETENKELGTRFLCIRESCPQLIGTVQCGTLPWKGPEQERRHELGQKVLGQFRTCHPRIARPIGLPR
jgi:hypothetical protein